MSENDGGRGEGRSEDSNPPDGADTSRDGEAGGRGGETGEAPPGSDRGDGRAGPDRRRVLAMLGAGAGVVGIAGSGLFLSRRTAAPTDTSRPYVSPAQSDAPTPNPPDHRSTVDAVADLEWDSSGTEPIALGAALEDGVRVEVPPGEYLVEPEPLVERGGGAGLGFKHQPTGLTDWALIGTGDDRSEVVFRAPQHTRGFRWLDLDDVRRIEVGNFTIDWQMARDTAGPGFGGAGAGEVHFHDMEWIGYTPPSDPGDAANCHQTIPTDARRADAWKLFVVLAEGTVGLVENVDVRGPSHIDGHRGGQGIGILTQNHAGTMVYRNCHWENVNGDGPVYSTASGKAIFEGLLVRNCAMACLRAGGDSIIRHCRVIQDHANQHAENTGQFCAANGIFWTSQTGEEGGGLIEDTEIIMEDTESTGRPLRVHNSAGELTLRNVDIVTHIDNDYPVWVKDPLKQYSSSYGNYRAKKPWNVDMEGVRLVGSGTAEAGIRLERRHGSTWRDVCIDLPNAHTGVATLGCTDLDFQRLNVAVAETPLDPGVSFFVEQDVTAESTCRDLREGGLENQ